MKDISVVDLFKAKVHFGHLKRFVSPKMMKYVYSVNNKISIINLDLTLKMLINALNFIESIIKNDGVILFVGTKKQASALVKSYSEKMFMPYVNFRWLGGLLTNFKTIESSVDKLKKLEEDVSKDTFQHLTKKEMLMVNRKLKKLKLNLDGIKDMKILPNALFIIDVTYESTALLEAKKLSIPVIGIVDTNSSPDNVDYLIPGNDDATDAIEFYLDVVSDHILKIKRIKEEVI